jgi:hypothetical protein
MDNDELLPAAGEKECTQYKNLPFFWFETAFFSKGTHPLLRSILTFLFHVTCETKESFHNF